MTTPHTHAHKKTKVSEEDKNDKEPVDWLDIIEDKISLDSMIAFVEAPEAGSISTFSGTTRNHHDGKAVLKLEYEAYVPMAKKELAEICKELRQKWDVIKVAMLHKVGQVPIGESSVVIVISSVHRKDSLEAVHFGIDEIKKRVPVWKKEFYSDGSMWKQNAEWNDHPVHKCC